jgi:hypothetical protein
MNLDETGIQIIPKHSRTLAPQGAKQVPGSAKKMRGSDNQGHGHCSGRALYFHTNSSFQAKPQMFIRRTLFQPEDLFTLKLPLTSPLE